jgi:hypothetical protein
MQSSTLAEDPETISIPTLDIEAIRADPNWEINHGITDRFFCRECAAELPDRIYEHLRKHGINITTYRSRWPGAPVASLNGRMRLNANARNWRAPRKKAPRVERVTAELLEEIRKDPAWEARNRLYDRVVCRICGAKISKYLRPHIVNVHRMTTAQYAREFRGAMLHTLIDTYAASPAIRSKYQTVEQYAHSRAAHFLEPAKLVECRNNPTYEIDHEMVGIICRECGFILRWRVVNKHLKAHGLNTITYRAKYGVKTPIQCAEIIASLRARHQRMATVRKPGPKKIDECNRTFFRIGAKVDAKIKAGKELTAARQAVANEESISYDSAVTYHKQYRKVTRQGGIGLSPFRGE